MQAILAGRDLGAALQENTVLFHVVVVEPGASLFNSTSLKAVVVGICLDVNNVNSRALAILPALKV